MLLLVSICHVYYLSFAVPACRDFLGYYSALGLSPSGDGPSQQDIKRAFRRAALEWHPDRQQVMNSSTFAAGLSSHCNGAGRCLTWQWLGHPAACMQAGDWQKLRHMHGSACLCCRRVA